MAYRRERGMQPKFDLFPFLGILACILGSLVMIVMSMTALSIGPGAAEVWMIEGTTDQVPVLIEWDGISVTIHPGKVRVPWGAAVENEGRNASPFGKLLSDIAAEKDKRYLFIAVRPSGFGNFADLRELIHKRGIIMGYEPIDQARPLGVE